MMQIFIDFFLSFYKFINERGFTALFFCFQIHQDTYAPMQTRTYKKIGQVTDLPN